jgi:hypothetical protein
MRDRLLTRHFLQRFLDNDLISPNADRHETLAVACAALITGGLFVTVLLSLKYLFQPFQSPARTAIAALDDRFLFIACSMIVMALVAVTTWDALALDDRDTSILGPLPVPRRVIVRAKLAAVAMFAAGFAVALNLTPTILHPSLMVAKLPIGVVGAATLIIVHAATTTAAGAFGFLSVLAFREVLHAALGHAWFGRISTLVQGCLVVFFSTAFLLLPGLSSGVTRTWLASGALTSYANPPIWFLGLQEMLAGPSIDRLPRGPLPPWILERETEATALYRSQQVLFQELGFTAIAAFGIVTLVAVATYAWNARRLPAPILHGRRGRLRVAALWSRVITRIVVRRPMAQAGFFFTLQSLSRSMPHRLALATAVAVGLAAATVTMRGVDVGHATDVASLPVSFLAVQSVLVTALLVGFRHALRVPASLRSNWAFHLAWPGDERPYFVGVKRAALVGLVLPILVALLPLHIWVLGSRVGLAHFACGLLMALVFLEVLLLGFRKVPFASSYEPGGNLKALGPIYVLAFLAITSGFASVERIALRRTRDTALFLAGAAALWLGVRMVDLLQRRTPISIELEEASSTTTQRLELNG